MATGAPMASLWCRWGHWELEQAGGKARQPTPTWTHTLAELIDPLLAAACWGVVEGSRIRREFSISPGRIEGGGRRGKPLSADDVLTYRRHGQR
jgi:hypothetical protein